MSVRYWSWFVLCILIVPIITIYTQLPGFDGPTIGKTNPIYDSPHTLNIAATTPHGPIDISGNQDFISQGWPGNGSQTNPYRLENLSISGNETCISISDTNAFFIVTACVLSAVNVYAGPPFALSVHFSNVTNGILMNSVVSSDSYAVLINRSQTCSIVSCEIDASSYGVHLENSSACTLSGSLIGSSWCNLLLEDTSQVRVLSNEMDGGYGGDYGIIVTYSSEFEIYNNEVHNHDEAGMVISESFFGVVINNTVYQNNDEGMEIFDAAYCNVINNSVYDNWDGISLDSEVNDCTLESNLIHDNLRGLRVYGNNNTISVNSFWANHDGNAVDGGSGNVWFHNSWDDYIGYGWYPVGGNAGTYDTDPEPKNITLLIATTCSILLIVLGGFMIALVIARRAKRAAPIEQGAADWDSREHLSMPLLFSMLLTSAVHLYLPAINPSPWFAWAATPLGVITWTGHPSWGHQAVEFVFPVTEDVQLLFFYILFGFVWFMLNAVVVRRFWLFTGGEIDKKTMKRTIRIVLLVMLAMSLATLTIPLPVTPLAALLQVSRFKDTDSSSDTVTQERTESKAILL